MRAVRAALVSIVLAGLALSGACTAIESVVRQPLPSPETLNLQAALIEGGGVMPGTQVVRISWSPPDEDLDIEFIVLEYSENENGPWEEVAAKNPSDGHHEHGGVFRKGSFHYYRVFMTRGQEETPRTVPLSTWIHDRGALQRSDTEQPIPDHITPTPLPGYVPPPTATPLPPLPGDTNSPFIAVPPTATPSVTATPTATPTRTPTPTPTG